MRGKRGTLGDVLTWFVATPIVFVLVILFLFLVGMYAGTVASSTSEARAMSGGVASAPIGEDRARVQLNSFLLMDVSEGSAAVSVLDYIKTIGVDYESFSKDSSRINYFNRTLNNKAEIFFSGQKNWGFYVSKGIFDNPDGTFSAVTQGQFATAVNYQVIPLVANGKKGMCEKGNSAYYKIKNLYIWMCVGGENE